MRKPTKAPVDTNRANIFNGLINDLIKDPKLATANNYLRQEALFIPELSYFSGEISTAEPDDTDPLLGGVDPCCYYVDSTSFMQNARKCYHYFQFFMPVTELCRSLLAEGILDYSILVTTNGEQLEEATVTLTRRRDDAKVRMSYGEANRIYRIRRMSDISSVTLWPRQKIEGWDTYYAFRYDEAAEASQISDRVYARYSIEPTDNASSCLLASQKRGGEAHRYYAMNKFPEYWAVKKKIGERLEKVGYIKTRVTAVPLPEAGNTFHTAVDFGTTSTMLYECVNNGVPRPIPASILYAGAVCNPNRIGNDQNTCCFIPPQSGGWKIALLHSLLVLTPQSPGAGTRAPLYGIWAFFRSAAAEKRTKPSIGGLETHSNLKWTGTNPFDAKYYMMEMLRFLALAARVNLCGSLHIYASYPAAMSVSRKDAYLQVVEETAEDIARRTGIASASISRITESYAVATEVVGGGLGTNFCAIDIGGGTSDIYLYYKRDFNTPWQGIGSSLKIGAREIFHSEFWRTPVLLDEILNEQINEESIKQIISQFETKKPNKDETFGIRDLKPENFNEEQMQSAMEELLDFAILEDGEFYPVANILRSIVVSSNNVTILNFRQRIALYLGAICYYAGMLAREREGLEPPLVSSLTIRFAGNGSKIINWISDKNGAISAFVKEMFRAGMATAELPQSVQYSTRPKHEVAYGALLSKDSALHVEDQNTIISGERFLQGGAIHSEFTSMDEVSPNVQIDPEQNEIKAFLAAFHRFAGRVVPCGSECRSYVFPDRDELGFKMKVLSIIDSQRRNNEEIKPFFLVGVEVIDAESRRMGGNVE